MPVGAVMYKLGTLCRVLWPGAGEMPSTVTEVVLTRPASGLALALKSRANANTKQGAVMDIVSSLSDITDPPNGVSAEDQGQFWLGYYHYLTAIEYARKYGATELCRAGEALYGARWQSDLSRALGLSDPSRLRQWLSGARPIPVGVWADVCTLLRQRQTSIDMILAGLDTGTAG